MILNINNRPVIITSCTCIEQLALHHNALNDGTIITLNGRAIARNKWKVTFPEEGDSIEIIFPGLRPL